MSRTTYADLFAAIGTTFGVGDGSTTFGLPDLRGEFVRGWDDGRGIDSGRVFGSDQADANAEHTHTASTNTTGAHTHTQRVRQTSDGTAAPNGASAAPNADAGQTGSAGSHSHTVTVDNAGGPESRPRNVALLYCIKH